MSKKYTELENFLISKDIRASAYNINEIGDDCSYNILDDGNIVEVFYFERGVKQSWKTFDSDDLAIEYFKQLILSNQTMFKYFDGKIN